MTWDCQLDPNRYEQYCEKDKHTTTTYHHPKSATERITPTREEEIQRITDILLTVESIYSHAGSLSKDKKSTLYCSLALVDKDLTPQENINIVQKIECRAESHQISLAGILRLYGSNRGIC